MINENRARPVAPVLATAVAFVLLIAVLAGGALLAAPAGAGDDDMPDDVDPRVAVPIGSSIGKLQVTDIRYLPRTIDELGEAKARVLVFTTTSCPIVRRYMPRLVELDADYRERGVVLVAVDVGPEDTLLDVAAQALEHGAPFPFVKDADGSVAAALGIGRTPEVVILDGENRLVYRGRIDDQVRLGGVAPKVKRHDLREALDEVLAGKAVTLAETPVDGCALTAPSDHGPGRDAPAPTWTEDVAPIVQRRCQDCHRHGGGAPLTLTSYDDARDVAAMMAEVVEQRRMPPWFADPRHGSFRNDQSLSDDERRTLLAWIAAGTPRGPADAEPPARTWPTSEWAIGEPDLVISMDHSIDIQKDGYMPYQYVILPHVFKEDTWVSAVEILPEVAEVLHHCNIGYTIPAEGRDTHFITGRVPGGGPLELRDGVGFKIPKGAILGLQIHYTPIGVATKDRIRVGLKFPRGPIRQQLRHLRIGNTKFEIPAGARHHPVRASRRLPHDAIGEGMFAHMHLRGKDMSFKARHPDGSEETLLSIPNYSFDWQLGYEWTVGAQRFPKGTRIEVEAHFDNSTWNPYNPDAETPVRFGLQTYHEMMYGFFFYVAEGEDLGIHVDPATGREVEAPAPAPEKRRVY